MTTKGRNITFYPRGSHFSANPEQIGLQSYLWKLCGFIEKCDWNDKKRKRALMGGVRRRDQFTPLEICQSILEFMGVSWERRAHRFHFMKAENEIPSWRGAVLQNSLWQRFGTIKSWLQTAQQHWFDTCHGCFVNTVDIFLPQHLTMAASCQRATAVTNTPKALLLQVKQKTFSGSNVGGLILHSLTNAGWISKLIFPVNQAIRHKGSVKTRRRVNSLTSLWMWFLVASLSHCSVCRLCLRVSHAVPLLLVLRDAEVGRWREQRGGWQGSIHA